MAIENSKNNEFYRLIYALGIRHIGKGAAKLLAKTFSNIEEIFSATVEELAAIEGFGEIMAQSVVDYFALEENRELIRNLEKLGLKMSEGKKSEGTAFDGKIFVLTGTLPNLSRNQATEMIEQQGGRFRAVYRQKQTLC